MDDEDSWPVWKRGVVILVICTGLFYFVWPYVRHIPAVLQTPSKPVRIPSKPPPPPPAASMSPTVIPTEGGYCYVGEWDNVRSCVEVTGGCMSNQVFPTHELCQNPQLRP
jgi:hypothetical protein